MTANFEIGFFIFLIHLMESFVVVFINKLKTKHITLINIYKKKAFEKPE